MHCRLGRLRTGENEERAFTWMKDSQDADLGEDKGIENGNCSKKYRIPIFPLLGNPRHRFLLVAIKNADFLVCLDYFYYLCDAKKCADPFQEESKHRTA